mmetsp:Transcript_102568/g.184985  ORF Transcript_102568/g.184985 Transcript_102568/m.184985 type:complete len:214 (-) Transcript_102568:903-1544(-)
MHKQVIVPVKSQVPPVQAKVVRVCKWGRPIFGKGTRHLLRVECLEIKLQLLEHRVPPDGSCSSAGTKPLWQLLEQGSNKSLDIDWKMKGKPGWTLLLTPPYGQHPSHDISDTFVLEGRLPRLQLVGQDPQRPPINCCVVGVRKVDHLRRHVVRSPGQSVGLPQDKPGKAHVTELGIAPAIQQRILWLHIPVNNSALVQVLQGCCDAGHVESNR